MFSAEEIILAKRRKLDPHQRLAQGAGVQREAANQTSTASCLHSVRGLHDRKSSFQALSSSELMPSNTLHLFSLLGVALIDIYIYIYR